MKTVLATYSGLLAVLAIIAGFALVFGTSGQQAFYGIMAGVFGLVFGSFCAHRDSVYAIMLTPTNGGHLRKILVFLFSVYGMLWAVASGNINDAMCGWHWSAGIIIGFCMIQTEKNAKEQGSFLRHMKASAAMTFVVLIVGYAAYLLLVPPSWFQNPDQGWSEYRYHAVRFGYLEIVTLVLAALALVEVCLIPSRRDALEGQGDRRAQENAQQSTV